MGEESFKNGGIGIVLVYIATVADRDGRDVNWGRIIQEDLNSFDFSNHFGWRFILWAAP